MLMLRRYALLPDLSKTKIQLPPVAWKKRPQFTKVLLPVLWSGKGSSLTAVN